jgi:HEAT repeat protein
MLTNNDNQLPPQDIASIYGENDLVKRGNLILQHYVNLLRADPEQLTHQWSVCITGLLNNNDKAIRFVVESLIQVLFDNSDFYPPQFHLNMQMQCITAIWSGLNETPALQHIMILKLWQKLQTYPETAALLLSGTPILSSPSMIELLAGQLKEKPDLTLTLLQKINTPVYKTSQLRVDSLRDKFFAQLLELYREKPQKVLSAMLALTSHGFMPREEMHKRWQAMLEADISEKAVSIDSVSAYEIFIELLTATAPQREQRIKLLIDKLLILNTLDTGIAQTLLIKLTRKHARDVFPHLLQMQKQGLLTIQQLSNFYSALPENIQRYYEDEVVNLSKEALQSDDIVKQGAALNLIARKSMIFPAVAEALSGDPKWDTQSLILLAQTCGLNNGVDVLLGAVLKKQVLSELLNNMRNVYQISSVGEAAASVIVTMPLTSEERQPFLSALLNCLQDQDDFTHGRAAAARAIRTMHLTVAERQPFLPVLLACLQDPEADVRAAVAGAIMTMHLTVAERQPFLPILLTCLQDRDWNILIAAARAIGTMSLTAEECQPFLPVLLTRLQDPEADVRAAVAKAIGRMSLTAEERQPFLPVLLTRLQDPKGDVRAAVAEAIGTMSLTVEESQPFLPVLLTRLQDRNWQVSKAAEKTIGTMPLTGEECQSFLSALLTCLQDPEQLFCTHIARVIGTMPLTAAERQPFLSALLNCLQNEHWGIRETAAETLKKWSLLLNLQRQIQPHAKIHPCLYLFLPLQEARQLLMHNFEDRSKWRNSFSTVSQNIHELQFNFSAWFQNNAASSLLTPAQNVQSLRLEELLYNLYRCTSFADGLPSVIRLFQQGVIKPCEQLFNAAFSVQTLSLETSKALTALLLQIPEFELAPEYLIKIISPVYLDANTSLEMCQRIERLLIDNHIQQLPEDILTKCLQRFNVHAERQTASLLANIDLTDTAVHTLVQALIAADKNDNARLIVLPLSLFFTAIAKLANSQLSSYMWHLVVVKINATPAVKALEAELQNLPLQQLLELHQLHGNTLHEAQRDMLITVLKRKLLSAPVHANTLWTAKGMMTLPAELHLSRSPVISFQAPGYNPN